MDISVEATDMRDNLLTFLPVFLVLQFWGIVSEEAHILCILFYSAWAVFTYLKAFTEGE